MSAEFSNNDAVLNERVEKALEERKKFGLEGLTGGLQALLVNVEQDKLRATVEELLRYTGYEFSNAFEDAEALTCVLVLPGDGNSADILVRSRKGEDNPFRPFNVGLKSLNQPDARLETLLYKAHDLEQYLAGQKRRGQSFLTAAPIEAPGFSFLQTPPSRYTGNSVGLIQWKNERREYRTQDSQPLDWSFPKPELPHLKNIGFLDHSATRVRAEERDDAIIEFMGLTDYNFVFAVYVEALNSITNVARLAPGEYAQVFTSGIKPFTNLEESGPTEKFIYNYGLRVHHLAFACEQIEATFDAMRADGMDFLSDLVGSPEEGLKQAFSRMSPRSYLVNEYIQRYDGFDGFFTKSNVTLLTKATEKQ